ncbi:hypothetical protein ACFE04_013415 [Oxalis oulophora]
MASYIPLSDHHHHHYHHNQTVFISFRGHDTRYNFTSHLVQNWCAALNEVAALSGWHFTTPSIGRNVRKVVINGLQKKQSGGFDIKKVRLQSIKAYAGYESELIEEIVADISRKLFEKSLSDCKVKTDLPKTLAANEVPSLSLDELKQATGNFGSKALLGETPGGEVFCAVFNNGKAFAVKTFDVSSPESDDNFLYQVCVVSRLKHENIVPLCGYFIEGDIRLLAYELAPRGTLHNILHARKGVLAAEPSPILDWMQRVRIAVDVASGLEYLHEKVQPSIVHGDIRSKSVLIYPDFTAKIVSLNLSCQDLDATNLLYSPLAPGGAVGYHAPEYAMGGKLTRKSDVYSFGIILLELLTGRKPMDYARPRGHQSLVTWASVDRVIESVDPKLNGQYPLDGVAKMASVAIICLQREAECRPNMSIIVKALRPLLEVEVSAPESY